MSEDDLIVPDAEPPLAPLVTEAESPLGAPVAPPAGRPEKVWVEALVAAPLRYAGSQLWPVRAGFRFRQPADLAQIQASEGSVRIVEGPRA